MTDPLARVIVERSPDGSMSTVSLIGEIDATNTAWISAQLNDVADATNQLTIDLTQLGYIDSHGMRTLQELADRHRRGSLDLSFIADPADIVWQLLIITGLDRIVPIHRPTAPPP